MKQPIVKVDGTHYNVLSVSWHRGKIHDIVLKVNGKVTTIFAPDFDLASWYSLKNSDSREFNYHSVEFVEEATS